MQKNCTYIQKTTIWGWDKEWRSSFASKNLHRTYERGTVVLMIGVAAEAPGKRGQDRVSLCPKRTMHMMLQRILHLGYIFYA
jgi:hypothetical protein